jgi:hypothetical protein
LIQRVFPDPTHAVSPRRAGLPAVLSAVLPAVLSAALLALLLAGPTQPAGAATYTVEPDGSGDFPTIQAAIDAATHGDVIELGDGVFTGSGNHSITFGGRQITVRSASDNPASCVLDLQGSLTNSVRAFSFTAEGPQTVIRGITIANGYICGS